MRTGAYTAYILFWGVHIANEISMNCAPFTGPDCPADF